MPRKKPTERYESHDKRQMGLFDEPYQKTSATSKAAAQSVESVAGKLRKAVYEMILEAGMRGLTMDEVEQTLGKGAQTITPRFWELENRHAIEKTDLTRATRSGRQAVVYRATLPRST